MVFLYFKWNGIQNDGLICILKAIDIVSAILVNDKEKHSLAQEKCEENLEKHHSNSTNSKTTSNSIDNNVTTHLCENDKGSSINIISTSDATSLGNF